MNDLNALLRAIITNPDDDEPRLMYADALDELPTARVVCDNCSGAVTKEWAQPPESNLWLAADSYLIPHSETSLFRTYKCLKCTDGDFLDTTNNLRAEYIRVSIQRHRLDDSIATNMTPAKAELANEFLQQRKSIRAREQQLIQQFPNITGAIQKVIWQQYENERGFTSTIVTTADDFLKGADAIIWHPEQKEEEVTEGPRKMWYDEMRPPEGDGWEINTSRGSDGWERFDEDEERYWIRPRPCPDTAQPIRTVTLTTQPHERDFGTINRMIVGEAGARIEYYRWPGVFFIPPPEPTG